MQPMLPHMQHHNGRGNLPLKINTNSRRINRECLITTRLTNRVRDAFMRQQKPEGPEIQNLTSIKFHIKHPGRGARNCCEPFILYQIIRYLHSTTQNSVHLKTVEVIKTLLIPFHDCLLITQRQS